MSTTNNDNSDTVAIARPSSIPADSKNTKVLAGRYHIERTIGTGGMGEIYLATDSKLQRKVAIKMMLHPEEDSDNKRFELESQTVAGFSDPHTIRLFDYGITTEGYQYQVIEYLEGKNIKEHIKSNGPIHPTIAKSIAIQLCGSLAEAHRKNILHRDLKPSNIMLIDSPERGVQCKLLDFGLARADNHDPTMTKTGMVLGSPMYMSPEQIESKSDELTAQTDIYSLGLTLYTMVSGKQPFTGASLSSILASQLFKDPTPLTDVNPQLKIEPALCWIIETAIQKKPEYRFVSISQMKKAIELALQNPEATLNLRDNELFCDEEFIQSYTSLSLQDISLAVDAMQDEHVATIKQKRPETLVEATESTTTARSNKTPLLLLGGLAVLGIIASILLPSGSHTVKNAPSKPTTVVPTTVTAPKTVTQSKLLALDLRSTPSGASIFVGNKYMGTTPSAIEVNEDEQTDTLILKLQGFQDAVVEWPKQSGIVTTTLIKQTERTPSVTPKNSPTEKKNNTSTTPPKKDKGVKKVTNPFE